LKQWVSKLLSFTLLHHRDIVIFLLLRLLPLRSLPQISSIKEPLTHHDLPRRCNHQKEQLIEHHDYSSLQSQQHGENEQRGVLVLPMMLVLQARVHMVINGLLLLMVASMANIMVSRWFNIMEVVE